MKFRVKWRLFAFYWQIPAGAIAFVRLSGQNRFSYPTSHFLARSSLNFMLLGLIFAFDRVFTVWEVCPSALRERRFGFKTKEIAWEYVIRVGLVDYQKPDSCAIEIEYVPAGATRACWLAQKVNPQERERFIAALQRFATRTTFDVEQNL